MPFVPGTVFLEAVPAAMASRPSTAIPCRRPLKTVWDQTLSSAAAGVVEDAQVHCPGVKIDATVESVRLVVETHVRVSFGMGPGPEPASWLEGAPFLKIPRWGQGLGLEPVYPWDRPRPIPGETMISITSLHRTAYGSR